MLTFSINMAARARDEYIHAPLEDVKRSRAVITFAEDDLAFLEVALLDRSLVQFKECAGDAGKHRDLKQIARVQRLALKALSNDFFISERTGRARNHALA